MRPIYYDTETTGVRAEKDFIIEIAAIDPVLGRTFESFVRPPVPIPQEATAIHGINDEMVAAAPSFKEVGQAFAEFCHGDTVLIAHNNDGFDRHFLRCEFERHQLPLPEWKYLDTLKWARRYRRDLPRHTLQFLRETYGFPANQAHRALDDVIVLQQVFEAMIDDLSIEVAYKLLNTPRSEQFMPFGKHQGIPLNQVPQDYVRWMAKNGAFDKPENQELKKSFIKLGFISE